jgi:hypothetical protein
MCKYNELYVLSVIFNLDSMFILCIYGYICKWVCISCVYIYCYTYKCVYVCTCYKHVCVYSKIICITSYPIRLCTWAVWSLGKADT